MRKPRVITEHSVKRHPFMINPDASEQELLDRLGEVQRLTAQAYNIFQTHQNEKHSLRDRLKKIRKERTTSKVTDHAMLRYLERVERLDLVSRAEMLSGLVPLDKHHANIDVVIRGIPLTLIVRENHIVTIKHKE